MNLNLSNDPERESTEEKFKLINRLRTDIIAFIRTQLPEGTIRPKSNVLVSMINYVRNKITRNTPDENLTSLETALMSLLLDEQDIDTMDLPNNKISADNIYDALIALERSIYALSTIFGDSFEVTDFTARFKNLPNITAEDLSASKIDNLSHRISNTK